MLFLQGTPGFRAHASRIFNVFSSVIDALDKDPDMDEIVKIVAESEKIFFNYFLTILFGDKFFKN
jgi:hypothetical protein